MTCCTARLTFSAIAKYTSCRTSYSNQTEGIHTVRIYSHIYVAYTFFLTEHPPFDMRCERSRTKGDKPFTETHRDFARYFWVLRSFSKERRWRWRWRQRGHVENQNLKRAPIEDSSISATRGPLIRALIVLYVTASDALRAGFVQEPAQRVRTGAAIVTWQTDRQRKKDRDDEAVLTDGMEVVREREDTSDFSHDDIWCCLQGRNKLKAQSWNSPREHSSSFPRSPLCPSPASPPRPFLTAPPIISLPFRAIFVINRPQRCRIIDRTAAAI